MIKSAFIIQPESNQDFYGKSTFKSCYFFLPQLFPFYFFFLSLVVFSHGPIGYKNQVYNYIPGFYSCYVLSKQWPNYSSHLGEFFISWHNNNYNN